MASKALALVTLGVVLATAGVLGYLALHRGSANQNRLEAFLTDISPNQPNLSLAGAPAVAIQVAEEGRYDEAAAPKKARVFLVRRRISRGQAFRRIVGRKMIARRFLEARVQGVVILGSRPYFLGPISIREGRPTSNLLDRDGSVVGIVEFLGRDDGIYRALLRLRGLGRPYELLVAPGHPNATRLFNEVNSSRPQNLSTAISTIRASYRG